MSEKKNILPRNASLKKRGHVDSPVIINITNRIMVKRFHLHIDYIGGLERADWVIASGRGRKLTTKTVQGTTLPLQRVDNIHGSDSLPLGMFGIRNSISDNILQEHFQHASRLFIDEDRDPLDSSTTGQASDGRLRDSLVLSRKIFLCPLSTTFPESFPTFASTSHDRKRCLLFNDLLSNVALAVIG